MQISIPQLVKNYVLPATLSSVSPSDSSPAIFNVSVGAEEQLGFEMVERSRLHRGADIQNLKLTESTSGVTGITIEARTDQKRLEISDEKRFHSLAIKEALGTLTEKESAELEELDRRRLVDQPPIDTETIIARERLLSKIEELIDEINSFGKPRRKTS